MESSVKEAITRIAKQVDNRKEFESRIVQAFGEQVLWEATGIYDGIWGRDYKYPPVEEVIVPPVSPISPAEKLKGQLTELACALLTPKGLFVLGAVAATSFLFYWYEYRPSEIRAECNTKAYAIANLAMNAKAKNEPWRYKERVEQGLVLISDVESAYLGCLRGHGLEPNPKQ